MLRLDIRHRQGDFLLDCTLHSEARVTGLFGASGAGKSSLLRAIAGLSMPDEGTIEIAGRPVFDRAAGLRVPAHRRRIGYVFQRARLFPHLSVRGNLRYGQRLSRSRGQPGEFDRVIDMLDIGDLLGRRVAGLSGGEQQRIAIGRALLCAPALLLLDEPLASLDAHRREEVLPYLERLARESALPMVFVSHQLDELLRIANRHVAVMAAGTVVFSGPTHDFLARPDLLGQQHADAGTLLRLAVTAHHPEDRLTELDCAGQPLFVPQIDSPRGAMATVHLRARDVMLATQRPVGISALNLLAATVETVDNDRDDAVRVMMRVGDHRIESRVTRRSARQLSPEPGQTIHAVVKSLALAEQAWRRLDGL